MSVDVPITDVNLPVASGLELAAEARSLHALTLIVFATGGPTSVRGIKDTIVVAKPYDARSLALSLAGQKKACVALVSEE